MASRAASSSSGRTAGSVSEHLRTHAPAGVGGCQMARGCLAGLRGRRTIRLARSLGMSFSCRTLSIAASACSRVVSMPSRAWVAMSHAIIISRRRRGSARIARISTRRDLARPMSFVTALGVIALADPASLLMLCRPAQRCPGGWATPARSDNTTRSRATGCPRRPAVRAQA